MIKIEIILILLLIGTQIMRISHIDGGDFLSFILLMTLSFLYMIAMFILVNGTGIRKFIKNKEYKKYNTFEIIIIVASGIALSTLLIGYLFRFLNWHGGQTYYVTGLILLVFTSLLYALLFRRKNSFSTKNILIRTVFWVLFATVFIEIFGLNTSP